MRSNIFSDLHYSEEAIAFQKDRAVVDRMIDIFERLINYIGAALQSGKRITIHDVNDQPEIKEMEDLVKARFGLNISFSAIGNGGAWTMPLILTTNHALLNRIYHGEANAPAARMLRELKQTSFKVDLEKAYISGPVTEYVAPLASELFWAKVLLGEYGLTAEELTAIMLHEIGHVFTFIEYSNRMSVGNQVLLEAIDNMYDESGSLRAKQYDFKGVEEFLEMENNEIIDAIQNDKNASMMLIRLSTRFVTKLTQQTADDHYYKTSSEQLADNFVVKFGLGKELAVGLDKLHMGGSPEKIPTMWLLVIFLQIKTLYIVIRSFIYLLIDVFKGRSDAKQSLFFTIAIGVISVFFPTYGMLFAAILGASQSLLGLIFRIYNAGDAVDNFSYDTLRDRTRRVLQGCIEELKDSNLTGEQLRVILGNIEELKQILDVKYDITKNLMGQNQYISPDVLKTVSNIVFSNNRRAYKEKQLQKIIEQAVSNDLFISSAKLKLMSMGQ